MREGGTEEGGRGEGGREGGTYIEKDEDSLRVR